MPPNLWFILRKDLLAEKESPLWIRNCVNFVGPLTLLKPRILVSEVKGLFQVTCLWGFFQLFL